MVQMLPGCPENKYFLDLILRPLVILSLSSLAHCPDTLSWFTVLTHCPGTLSWYTVLVQCPGTVSWYSVLVWYTVLVHCPGTLSWYCPGTVSWHSVLVLSWQQDTNGSDYSNSAHPNPPYQ